MVFYKDVEGGYQGLYVVINQYMLFVLPYYFYWAVSPSSPNGRTVRVLVVSTDRRQRFCGYLPAAGKTSWSRLPRLTNILRRKSSRCRMA